VFDPKGDADLMLKTYVEAKLKCLQYLDAQQAVLFLYTV
jgi:hypothetical protein